MFVPYPPPILSHAAFLSIWDSLITVSVQASTSHPLAEDDAMLENSATIEPPGATPMANAVPMELISSEGGAAESTVAKALGKLEIEKAELKQEGEKLHEAKKRAKALTFTSAPTLFLLQVSLLRTTQCVLQLNHHPRKVDAARSAKALQKSGKLKEQAKSAKAMACG